MTSTLQAVMLLIQKKLKYKLLIVILSVVAIPATMAFDHDEYDQLILGKSFFRIPWVAAPASTTARDGLGPLFNANTCKSCHNLHNGRGTGGSHRSAVVLVNIGSNGFVPEPTYGSQININAVSGVAFEAKPIISYQYKKVTYPDGRQVILKKPLVKLEQLNYGPLHPQANLSIRIAPALIGLGLLEAIPERDILANQDIEDRNHDGISGKANMQGRFTWKASVPSLKQQIANAANNDMGLTNPLYPNENCTKNQIDCLNAPKGKGGFDLPMERLNAINFYLKNLKPAQLSITETQGQQFFNQIGCHQCHKPSFTLASGKIIHPYSDLLLHDMGEGLNDNRQELLAEPSEWRTAPLWGIGNNFLHDGRASTIEEAILWHGGEALPSKMLFMELPIHNREKLLKFVSEI